MSKSKIQWTDETWNPVTGCTKVSAGCKNCYAEWLAPRVFAGQRTQLLPTVDGNESSRPRRFTDVRCHEDRLDKPLHWRKPRRVFVNSMSDLFHEAVPDAFIDRVFAVMAQAPWHVFQILTKRPERFASWFPGSHLRMTRQCRNFVDYTEPVGVWPLPNVHLGVSVEDQATADERIPLLLDTPAAVRFVSAEPLLEAVDLRHVHTDTVEVDTLTGDHGVIRPHQGRSSHRLDQVIVGGESGPKARPCDVAWIRSIVEQCKAAGTAVFVKQLGAHVRDRNDAGFSGDPGDDWDINAVFDVEPDPSDTGYQGAPARIRLRDPKGGDMVEWPEDLRVREMPSAEKKR